MDQMVQAGPENDNKDVYIFINFYLENYLFEFLIFYFSTPLKSVVHWGRPTNGGPRAAQGRRRNKNLVDEGTKGGPRAARGRPEGFEPGFRFILTQRSQDHPQEGPERLGNQCFPVPRQGSTRGAPQSATVALAPFVPLLALPHIFRPLPPRNAAVHCSQRALQAVGRRGPRDG